MRLFDVNKKQNIELKGSENQYLDRTGQRLQVSGKENSWRIFQIKHDLFPSEKINLMKPNDKGVSGSPTTIECQIAKLKFKQEKRTGLNENIADIKFKVDKNCETSNGNKICDLTIAPSHNLEWTQGFKPKVGFCGLLHHHQEL